MLGNQGTGGSRTRRHRTTEGLWLARTDLKKALRSVMTSLAFALMTIGYCSCGVAARADTRCIGGIRLDDQQTLLLILSKKGSRLRVALHADGEGGPVYFRGKRLRGDWAFVQAESEEDALDGYPRRFKKTGSCEGPWSSCQFDLPPLPRGETPCGAGTLQIKTSMNPDEWPATECHLEITARFGGRGDVWEIAWRQGMCLRQGLANLPVSALPDLRQAQLAISHHWDGRSRAHVQTHVVCASTQFARITRNGASAPYVLRIEDEKGRRASALSRTEPCLSFPAYSYSFRLRSEKTYSIQATVDGWPFGSRLVASGTLETGEEQSQYTSEVLLAVPGNDIVGVRILGPTEGGSQRLLEVTRGGVVRRASLETDTGETTVHADSPADYATELHVFGHGVAQLLEGSRYHQPVHFIASDGDTWTTLQLMSDAGVVQEFRWPESTVHPCGLVMRLLKAVEDESERLAAVKRTKPPQQ